MGIAGTYKPDDLYNGVFPMVTEARAVPSGTAAFRRGTVLTGANVPVVSGTKDSADCIALEDCDASSGEGRCVVALCGGFNTNALLAGDSTDPAALKAALRAKSIYIARAVR